MLPTRVEITPGDGIIGTVKDTVPPTTTLTIRCLPRNGLKASWLTAVTLAGLGYDVVPHIAARNLEDRPQLAGLLRDYQGAGIKEVLVISGDATHAAGPYGSSVPLMEDIAHISGGSISMGIAGYPEGHPERESPQRIDALLEKQHLAAHVVTQMCFSSTRISAYIGLLRSLGIELPVWAGVPGAVHPDKLVPIARQIGVGTSLRLLSRKGPLARKLLTEGAYSPGNLISELSGLRPGPAGIHLHSFNNLPPDSTRGVLPVTSDRLTDGAALPKDVHRISEARPPSRLAAAGEGMTEILTTEHVEITPGNLPVNGLSVKR